MAVITACNVRDVDSENFDYKLQGTWESNDKSLYSGTLYIDYNTITIKGYGEGQTRPNEDDDRRPFKGFIKETPLKGYSAEGKIFINNVGNLQDGIPYSYNNPSSGAEFLFLTFGGRQEILQKIQPN
jgi:hypothetical protein